MKPVTDLTNQVFANILVMVRVKDFTYFHKKSNKTKVYIRYKCSCIGCGKTYLKRHDQLLKITEKCRNKYCKFFKVKAPGNSNRDTKTEKPSQINYRFRQYRRSANKKGLSFEISLDDFCCLIKANCHYCSTPPLLSTDKKLFKPFHFNGVDRVDNLKGYTKDNIVTCCKICNYAKRNMTLDAFKTHVKHMYETLFK